MRTPPEHTPNDLGNICGNLRQKTQQHSRANIEDREIRIPNLLIWSQTRYRCAIASGAHEPAMETRKTKMFTMPLPVMAWTKMTVKGTLSE